MHELAHQRGLVHEYLVKTASQVGVYAVGRAHQFDRDLAIRERIASGTRFPNDLQALAASDLKIDDPFTGKPLLTLHTNHSLLIYSVGRDRIDNHGHRPGKEFPTNNDIVFEIRADAIPRRPVSD